MSAERVADISEFQLIGRLQSVLPERALRSDRLDIGIGDDAAVAKLSPGEQLVVSTDTLNEGVHFRFDWTSWRRLGHKALAVNLSDLAAMGATPLIATVSLALTGDELIADLEEMYRGMGQYAASNQTVIAGGDITRTTGPLSIAVTAIGETRNRRLLRRSAAQPNDLIWVTGTIGAAAAGLQLELLDSSDPRKHAATADSLRGALHEPLPRLNAGRALAAMGVRCAMDLSDGLTGDLYKILTSSHVDAELSLWEISVLAAVTGLFGSGAIDLALYGGEDYELLFTSPHFMANEISEGLELIGIHATVIGQIRSQFGAQPRITGIERHGKRHILVPRGFDHFGAK